MKNEFPLTLLGISAPATGVAISMTTIELWMRLASLGIGILIGLFVLRKHWNHRND